MGCDLPWPPLPFVVPAHEQRMDPSHRRALRHARVITTMIHHRLLTALPTPRPLGLKWRDPLNSGRPSGLSSRPCILPPCRALYAGVWEASSGQSSGFPTVFARIPGARLTHLCDDAAGSRAPARVVAARLLRSLGVRPSQGASAPVRPCLRFPARVSGVGAASLGFGRWHVSLGQFASLLAKRRW